MAGRRRLTGRLARGGRLARCLRRAACLRGRVARRRAIGRSARRRRHVPALYYQVIETHGAATRVSCASCGRYIGAASAIARHNAKACPLVVGERRNSNRKASQISTMRIPSVTGRSNPFGDVSPAAAGVVLQRLVFTCTTSSVNVDADASRAVSSQTHTKLGASRGIAARRREIAQ